MTETEATAWLQRDPLLHVSITEPLRRGTAHIIEARPTGVAAGLGGWLALVSATDAETAFELYKAALAQGIGKDDLLLHQAEFAGPIMAAFGLRQSMAFYQVAKMDRVPLPLPDCGAEMRPLGPEHLAFVEAHYHSEPGYIADRHAAGVLVGAFVNGELVGFAGEHDEGALGLLYVLPEYRRRHIGRLLGAAKVNAAIARGQIPFGQVETHNVASLAMQRAAGFDVHPQKMAWLTVNGVMGGQEMAEKP